MIFNFEHIFDGIKWLENQIIETDKYGKIVNLSASSDKKVDENIKGYFIPGFINAHSHAFQYSIAGLTEHAPTGEPQDNFWSWRETMYKRALIISPLEVQDIATMLYSEMLRMGITHVVEFHYLHHDPDGQFYSRQEEMSHRIIEAANRANIGLTLIPIYYNSGYFKSAPNPKQKRFIHKSPETYLNLLNSLTQIEGEKNDLIIGHGLHSLRAAPPEQFTTILNNELTNGPIHIHISEQVQEVEDCIRTYQKRPVELLSEMCPFSERLNLVHATHINDQERKTIVQSGTNIVICPSTEANLGDGFFDLIPFNSQGGHWSIGTDSHISTNMTEDLRWLEYQSRLQTRKRNILSNPGEYTGNILFQKALYGGLRSAGLSYKEESLFQLGKNLNGILLDHTHPIMAGKKIEEVLSGFIFASDLSIINGTMRSGKWIVRNQKHLHQTIIRKKYRETIESLSRKIR